MSENKQQSVDPVIVVASVASLLALVLLVASGFGSRFGWWHFRTGFAILKWAAFLGLGSALLGAVTGFVALRGRRMMGVGLAVVAILCGSVAFGLPYSWKLKAQRYPRIHDISTDVDHPPQFVAVANVRHDPVLYPGALVAAQQLKAYPDLKTLILNVPMLQAYQAALEAVRELGWDIVAEAPGEGRIEATDTTFWYGFKDDIVIRVFPAGDRSLVDVRSVSRVGISDVGTNAERVRKFLAKLSQRPAPK